MSIAFKCACGRALQAKPEMAGKKTKCPGCGTILTIPSGAPAAAPAAKPAAPKTSPAISVPAAAPEIVACSCGTKIRTKPEWAGKSIKCPKCASLIKIPGGAAAAAPAAPAVAPARPVPKPKPAPAPIEDDDPFAGGEISGPSEDPYGGAGSFSDESDDDEPTPAPARKRAATPPPKKGGIGKLILLTLFLVLLAGGVFAAYCHFVEGINPIDFVMGTSPQPIPAPKVEGKKPPVKIDGKQPEAKEPKSTDPDPKELKDPVPPVVKDPEPKLPDVKDPDAKDPEIKNPDPKNPIEPIPPAGVANPITYVGADGAVFVSLKPQALFKTAIAQKLLAGLFDGPDGKEKKAMADLFGVGPADVTAVAASFKETPSPDNLTSGLVFVAMAKPVQRAGFEKFVEFGKLEKKMSPTMLPFYVVQAGPKTSVGIALSGDRVLIVGEEERVSKFLASQTPKDGPLAAALKNASEIDHCLHVGAQLPKDLVDMGLKKADKEGEALIPIAEAKTVEVALVADATLKFSIKLDYADEAKAEAAKKGLDAVVAKAKEFLPVLAMMAKDDMQKKLVPIAEDAIKSATPTMAGTSVVLPIEIKLSVDDVAEMLMPFFPVDQPKGEFIGDNKENNLLFLAMAMNSYYDNFNKFPTINYKGFGGKGNLSWRCAILPYLEQQKLFDAINKDESWDSEHNKKLIEAMPAVLEHRTRKAPPGHTYYRVIVGPQTLYPESKDPSIKMNQISDGKGATILIVEARDPVIWTKPDEVVYDPKGPLPELGDGSGEIRFATIDMGIHTLNSKSDDIVRALITATGGEPVKLNNGARLGDAFAPGKSTLLPGQKAEAPSAPQGKTELPDLEPKKSDDAPKAGDSAQGPTIPRVFVRRQATNEPMIGSRAS